MRALDILDETLLGPAKFSSVAGKLGLSKTTTHRLAHALRSRGYLTVTVEGIALGPKLLQLGAVAKERVDYVRVVRPFLEQLSETTGFCAFVGKREGDSSRHLDRATGRQRLRVATAPGDRRPIAETGIGKALLFDEDEQSLARLYAKSTAANPDPLAVQGWLAAMRRHIARGVVLHESEIGDGVRSVAAPVRDADGNICVAISIASAAHYLTEGIIVDVAHHVANTAERVSRELGYDRAADR
ncbi:IclR family transcriptional regulator [Sphingomonas sp. JC676]|uniref:IclR family transcriptional regulator n=1 Tax=Sphingomonas sp. JC676 TaxID=2768065 RepID=UPI00165809C5|nr:IclR family transcriptional regulator [Sphingomonas sp. JC676]MBC9032400.1 IclR family transcriptional regulator [Sphingomonas sp. JC676]